MQLAHYRTARRDDIFGQTPVRRRRDIGQSVGYDGNRLRSVGERGAVACGIDAVGKTAHDRQIAQTRAEPLDQHLAHALACGRDLARTYHRECPARKRTDTAAYIYHVGIIGRKPHGLRIVGIGRGHGPYVITTAIVGFALGLPQRLAADDAACDILAKRRPGHQLLLRDGEYSHGGAEVLQQVHDAAHAQPGRHGKGYVEDIHIVLQADRMIKIAIYIETGKYRAAIPLRSIKEPGSAAI